MKITAFIFLAILLLSGCQKEEVLPVILPQPSFLQTTMIKGITDYTMEFEGAIWKYSLDVPLNYNSRKSYPLVFILKGKRGTSARLITDFHNLINTRQYIAVYPESYDAAGWNLGTDPANPLGDVRFIQALTAELTASGHIKTNKIYGMGISNGGCMVHYLALRTNIFAAVAPVAGSMYEGISTSGAGPVSVMQVHGLQDLSVPYNGGFAHDFTFYSAPGSISFWALQNGCDAAPVISSSIPGALVHQYNGCDNGLETILFSVPTSGHDVLSSFSTIDLKSYIFDFFKRHQK
jgi:polyhydroxybutyrate depolymerase